MATIKKNALCDLGVSCKELYLAIKGLGTDKLKIVQVLTTHDSSQRQQIKEKYKFMYEIDLKSDIKGESTVSGYFREALFALLDSPDEFDAKTLHSSLHLLSSRKSAFLECIKNRTNVRVSVIFEIMITRTFEELKSIQEFYTSNFKTDLDNDFKKSFYLGHSLIKLLRTLAAIKRSDDTKIDVNQATEDAKSLLSSESVAFINETELVRLFCYRSFPQITKILEEYSKLSNKELSVKIKENNEFEQDFKEGLLEIIQYATDSPGYFAKKLNEHLNNGSKDYLLIRVLVSRSEKDLELIKNRYNELFNRKLLDIINQKTSSHYQNALKALVKDENIQQEQTII